MKTILLFLLLVSFQKNTLAQHYDSFYLSCNTSDSLFYFRQTQAALDTLKIAFNKVPYVPSWKLSDAYWKAAKAGDYDLAYRYGRQTLIHSGNIKKLQAVPKEFKKSNQYQQLKDSSLVLVKMSQSNWNHSFIQLIDSLFYLDQRIVRNNKSVRGSYQIDKKTLPQNRFDLDSSIWQTLYAAIQKYGFPDEQLVGEISYDNMTVILHHNLRLAENEKYHPEFIEYIRQGKYDARYFLFWYEQFQMNVYKTTYFTTWDGNISPENLARIDKNLRSLWLKGITSFKLSKEGRSMVRIW